MSDVVRREVGGLGGGTCCRHHHKDSYKLCEVASNCCCDIPRIHFIKQNILTKIHSNNVESENVVMQEPFEVERNQC